MEARLDATWNYDSFGNRSAGNFSGSVSGDVPIPPSTSVTYYSNNQVQSVQQGGNPAYPPEYDAAGNMLCDSYNSPTCYGNQYVYDAEGRICAVATTSSGMWGYLYDADGNRVAKGRISSLSCDTSSNGFTLTNSFIVSQSGQQLTEMDWSGSTLQSWHTNVWAAGQLIATYSDPDLSQSQTAVLDFQFGDWLGTRRVLTDYTGNPEESCDSLPYGDGETCAPTPTEHLFTQHERDAETWNDYFGARYYASTMGRFLSPDPSGLYFADPTNPQSLNLYTYGLNNPLINTDLTGYDCVYFNDAGNGVESIDQNSNSKECGANGGDWINGTVNSWQYDSGSDTFTFKSGDSSNNYLTMANAPGTEMGGYTCSGNCDTANGYFQSSNISLGLFGLPTTGALGQAASGAPNNGPSYSHEDVCAASAVLNKGGAFFLDLIGIAPGVGAPERVVQTAAAAASASMATLGNSTPADAALAGAGLGTTIVDDAKVMGEAARAAPILGNFLSGVAAVRDFKAMQGYYNDCLVGKN